MTDSLSDKILPILEAREQEWQQQLNLYEERIKALEAENAELQEAIGEGQSPWSDIADNELRERLIRLGNPPLDTIIREAGVILEHRLRRISGLDTSLVGAKLVDAAFDRQAGSLQFSSHGGEQDGVRMLYRGAMQFIRNPPMHKLIEYPEKTAHLLVRLIDSLLLLLSEGPSQNQEEKRWNESSFFPELERRRGVEQALVARKILEWAKQNMPSIWWGKGTRSGSFIPGLDHKGTWHNLFGVWTGGGVELQFQYMKSKAPFDSETKRLELLRRWNEVPGINISEDKISRRPSISLSVLQSEADLNSFFAVLNWAIDEIKAS